MSGGPELEVCPVTVEAGAARLFDWGAGGVEVLEEAEAELTESVESIIEERLGIREGGMVGCIPCPFLRRCPRDTASPPSTPVRARTRRLRLRLGGRSASTGRYLCAEDIVRFLLAQYFFWLSGTTRRTNRRQCREGKGLATKKEYLRMWHMLSQFVPVIFCPTPLGTSFAPFIVSLVVSSSPAAGGSNRSFALAGMRSLHHTDNSQPKHHPTAKDHSSTILSPASTDKLTSPPPNTPSTHAPAAHTPQSPPSPAYAPSGHNSSPASPAAW